MSEPSKSTTRSSTTLRRISIILALLGIIVAAYLTYLHLTDSGAALCAEGGGCDTVRDSRYSEIGGVPVAIVGLIGYLMILGGLLAEEFIPSIQHIAVYSVFGFSLFGTLYSIYLTYLEIFIIVAICPYCVISAILIAGIFGIAIYRTLYLLE